MQTEQFVGSSGIYSVVEILITLQRSERELLQLKFQGVCFTRNSDQLFEAVSSKIQALSFLECSFEKNVLENILIKCSNLKQLTITSISYQQLLLLLDYVKQRNNIKTDVIFLEIDLDLNNRFCSENYFDDTFGEQIIGNGNGTFTEQIISIFPNLQYLKINTVFQKSEIPSILNGIKELGLRVLHPLTSDNCIDRILPFTK